MVCPLQRYSPSLNIRERQIKTIARDYVTPVKMALIPQRERKKSQRESIGEDGVGGVTCSLLLGRYKCPAPLKPERRSLNKLKTELPYGPPSSSLTPTCYSHHSHYSVLHLLMPSIRFPHRKHLGIRYIQELEWGESESQNYGTTAAPKQRKATSAH